MESEFIQHLETSCPPCPISYSYINLNRPGESEDSSQVIVHVYELELEWISSLSFILDKALESSVDGKNVCILWTMDALKPWTFSSLESCIKDFNLKSKGVYPHVNMGLLMARTDAMDTLELAQDQLDLIQQTQRKLCLECDMSLIYTSLYAPKSMQRVYYFAFQDWMTNADESLFEPNYLERDSIYIPKDGWDSFTKIKALNEKMNGVTQSLSDYFSSFHGKDKKVSSIYNFNFI